MLKHFPLVKILCSARAPVHGTENTCSADRWREAKPYLSRVESLKLTPVIPFYRYIQTYRIYLLFSHSPPPCEPSSPSCSSIWFPFPGSFKMVGEF